MLSESSFRRHRALYLGYRGGAYLGMGISVLALVGLVAYILFKGAPYLSFDLLFGDYSFRSVSLLPAFIGTGYLILISLGIAAPIGYSSSGDHRLWLVRLSPFRLLFGVGV